MENGKKICRTLKELRKRIADANGIPYEIEECTHRGECPGTCPKCEAEVEYILDCLHDKEQEGGRAVLDDIMSEDELRRWYVGGPQEFEENREAVNNPDEFVLAGIPAPPERDDCQVLQGDIIGLEEDDDFALQGDVMLSGNEDEPKNDVIEADLYISLPDYYQRLDTLPEDPDGAAAFGFMSEEASCILTAYAIDKEKAMDFNDEAALIEGIHGELSPTQALIEVGKGMTFTHRKYIYSIIKNAKEPHGVQYFALLHFDIGDAAMCVNAFFDEQGVTGQRETLVYAMLQSNGTLDKLGGFDAWCTDPYDYNFKRPYLMNLSELRQFDEGFPGHPLTLCRQMIEYVTSKI